jgi:outer membrane protein
MKHISSLLIFAVILLFAQAASAQTLKIGFVDSQKIFEGLPEAKVAQEELDAKLSVWQDSLDAMIMKFQEEYKAFEAQQSMMAEPVKEQKQKQLLALQSEIQEYLTRIFGQTGAAAQLREEYLKPLQKKVLIAIEKVAKAEKINFMFDKVEDATIMLYADAKFDYTFKVLDKLKRGDN